jgi:5-methyltetrahydropteroyltriglutamate--homocysteine methyltransferase
MVRRLRKFVRLLTMVEAHLTGVFPRSEKLIDATRAAVRGNLPQVEVDRALQEDVVSLVDLQKHSVLDAFVDGQLNWQDLFRPFDQLLNGVEPGSLTRWFDNNTFYRRPIIAGKVSLKSGNFQQYFRTDLLPRDIHRKAILPGPFTFAYLSENRTYSTFPDLVHDLAQALRGIATALQGTGYEYFQFNEPALCAPGRTKSDLEIAKRAFETCAQGIGGKRVIQTYFGDASPVIDTLLDYPVDSIGVDFYATSLDSLKDHDFNKVLGCGWIDGRNSLLESAKEISTFVANARKDLEPADIYLTPNCDLEFLPEPVAEKKVRLLGEDRRLLV